MKLIAPLLLFLMPLMLISGEYRVGDHELLLMPTGYTMPKGQSYFSDYELFLLNYTYAVTPRTHAGVFTLFPITDDFLETFTVGVKQNYYRAEKAAFAVWATFTPKISGLTLGNVFSLGKPSNSLHLGISAATEVDDEGWEFIYMVGYRRDVSRKVSLIAEYTNFSSFVEEDFNGMISLGLRFRSEDISWELAGVRPLESTGDLLFVPLLKATILIK
ncbi:MAG: hypothetical protein P8184_11710 [Calditrichia bacterium]